MCVLCGVMCVSLTFGTRQPGVSWATPHVGVGGDGGLLALPLVPAVHLCCVLHRWCACVLRAAHSFELGTLHTSGRSVLCFRMTHRAY